MGSCCSISKRNEERTAATTGHKEQAATAGRKEQASRLLDQKPENHGQQHSTANQPNSSEQYHVHPSLELGSRGTPPGDADHSRKKKVPSTSSNRQHKPNVGERDPVKLSSPIPELRVAPPPEPTDHHHHQQQEQHHSNSQLVTGENEARRPSSSQRHSNERSASGDVSQGGGSSDTNLNSNEYGGDRNAGLSNLEKKKRKKTVEGASSHKNRSDNERGRGQYLPEGDYRPPSSRGSGGPRSSDRQLPRPEDASGVAAGAHGDAGSKGRKGKGRARGEPESNTPSEGETGQGQRPRFNENHCGRHRDEDDAPRDERNNHKHGKKINGSGRQQLSGSAGKDGGEPSTGDGKERSVVGATDSGTSLRMKLDVRQNNTEQPPSSPETRLPGSTTSIRPSTRHDLKNNSTPNEGYRSREGPRSPPQPSPDHDLERKPDAEEQSNACNNGQHHIPPNAWASIDWGPIDQALQSYFRGMDQDSGHAQSAASHQFWNWSRNLVDPLKTPDSYIATLLSPHIDSNSTLHPFHLAAALGRKSIILAQSQRDDINMGDNRGRTPLAWAALTGQVNVVNILLKNADGAGVTNKLGLDLNSLDNDGYTPVMIAIKGSHLAVVEALLKRDEVRRDLNHESKDGTTALGLAVSMAMREGDLSTGQGMRKLVQILKSMGANVALFKSAEVGERKE